MSIKVREHFWRALAATTVAVATVIPPAVWTRSAVAQVAAPAAAKPATAKPAPTKSGTRPAEKPDTAAYPPELVEFTLGENNPVFKGAGPGHWDAMIRERGWIMVEGGAWHLWYTGYDGTREGLKQLGYATSHDGLHWTRHPDNPLVRGHWVEDMMVVKNGDTYYMFAEGLKDEAHWLTSKDRVHWERQGKLDVRRKDGQPLAPGPLGTPTAWLENGVWHLFYERADLGIWLAKSNDLKVWTNVQDEPVIVPGPAKYDLQMIALNQIVKHEGRYYAYYHGSGEDIRPRKWTTNIARSDDLVHWEKYARNPIVPGDRSSGILVQDGAGYRLYTMHPAVDVFYPRSK